MPDLKLNEKLEDINESKQAIKQALIDKGQNPTNVLSTYAGLIENITTSEDLETELSAQEQLIQELKEALANKTAGSAKPNIFVQTTEPTKKDGIWLQTDKEFDKIYCETQIDEAETYIGTGLANPSVDGQAALMVTYNNDVYYVNRTYGVYKYSVSANTHTKLSDMPSGYDAYVASIGIVDDTIYVFGGTSNQTKAYKFNITRSEWESITDIPVGIVSSPAVTYGTDIYIFGNESKARGVYKYDTLTDTYTELSTCNINIIHGTAVLVGQSVYLFLKNNASRYDINTDTYTALAGCSSNIYSASGSAYGDSIYLFGGNYSLDSRYKIYKYSISSNSYTLLSTSMTKSIAYNTNTATIDNRVYMLSYDGMACFISGTKAFDDNSLILLENANTYKAVLYNSDIFDTQPKYAFGNIYHYTTEGGLDNTIPTYYGDGTQWIKFKN